MSPHLKTVSLHADQFPTDEHYPFNLSVLRRTEGLSFDVPVTFLVGDNGTGKSTLLEAIARQCQIHIWSPGERRRVEFNPYEGQLYRHLSVEWAEGKVPGSFFGADIFGHFAQVVDEWAAADPGQLKYFGGESLLTRSHGQSLMAFFRSRYTIKGLYLLDEPETALAPDTQLDLLRLLRDASGAGHAQFIIATHSPILLACPGACIYSFDETPVARVAYRDTLHYRVYRDFMANPEGFLAEE